MVGIDPDVVCHQLSTNLTIKIMAQRKQKRGEEKLQAISKEVEKKIGK